MDTDQILRAVFLFAIVLYLATGFMGRGKTGRQLQALATWGLIIFGTFLAVSFWQNMQTDRRAANGKDQIRIVRENDGHYYLDAQVNGVAITFVVDTGASNIVLSQSAAKAAGIAVGELNYFGRAQTANGEVRIAPIRIETLVVEDVTDKNLRAVVNEGELDTSLLGMDYLNRFSRIEIENGSLILTR